jgi:hypothetical protein
VKVGVEKALKGITNIVGGPFVGLEVDGYQHSAGVNFAERACGFQLKMVG